MGISHSHSTTQADISNQIVASILQESDAIDSTNVSATQEIACHDCCNCNISNVNLSQVVQVNIQSAISALQKSDIQQEIANQLQQAIHQYGMKLQQAIISSSSTQENTNIKNAFCAQVQNITKEEINNAIKATQGIIGSDCGNFTVTGSSLNQSLYAIVTAALSSSQWDSILSNSNTVVIQNITEYTLLFIIGGIILLLIIGIIIFLVFMHSSPSKAPAKTATKSTK